MTAVAETPAPPPTPAPVPSKEQPPADEVARSIPRWAMVLGVVVVWIVIWSFTKGNNTLEIVGRVRTPLWNDLTGFRDSVLESRDTNPVIQLTTNIAEIFRNVFAWLQGIFSVPDFPRPVPRSAGSA